MRWCPRATDKIKVYNGGDTLVNSNPRMKSTFDWIDTNNSHKRSCECLKLPMNSCLHVG